VQSIFNCDTIQDTILHLKKYQTVRL